MNERKIQSGKFTITVSHIGLLLSNSGSGSIKISAAEVDKLCTFLGAVKVLSGKLTLPPHITSTPFRIFFGEGKEDTTLTLYRKGGRREDMVPFTFGEVDEFIILLNNCVHTWKDILRLDPLKSTRPAIASGHGVPFEGLD